MFSSADAWDPQRSPALGGTGDAPAKPAKRGRTKGPKVIDKAAAKSTVDEPAPVPVYQPLRRRRWLDRARYYEPSYAGMKTTTRQAEALNIAMAGPPSSQQGLFVGQ